MDSTRRDFVKLLVVFGAGGAMVACGGGGGGGGGGDCSKNGAHDTAITGNHGHVLMVPAADFGAGVDKTYSIMGTASHDHSLTLTAAQLTQLSQGQMVTSTSSTTNSHMHDVTVGCA